MTSSNDEASFTFSWLALRLLGRGLYSNPWSALSELVANGIDAGADEVYVYVDAQDKGNAIVEVIDNGRGMSRADIETYVKVGHDKRQSNHNSDIFDPKTKGRKGIGKLAALFLSSHFYLDTRHTEGGSSWELDAREAEVDLDAYPKLLGVPDAPSTPNDALWSRLTSGTRLTMLGVDLTGYGSEAVNALGARLANQFLIAANASPRILLCVRTAAAQTDLNYTQVSKSIAFGNLVAAMVDYPDSRFQPVELASSTREVLVPAKGLPGDVYAHSRRVSRMDPRPQEDEAWNELSEDVDLDRRTYRGVRYRLSGWIGVHATIDKKSAQKNDERFTKNRFYNPAQLRVYVRDKLANDQLLTQLGLTGTYVNYIEGEITFDLLDDDSLPDIATSNRQDFDETDKRVALLRALVRPLVRSLIQERNKLASEISRLVNREKLRRDTASKRQFVEQLHADLEQYPEISPVTRDDLQLVIANKIQGDVSPKQTYRVFISHARVDRAFAVFIDELLRDHGATEEEIFFTSRTGATDVLLDAEALSEVVKRNITNDNTLIFYVTSKNFLASQFCLFEGGAGWATRAVSEYLKLNIEYGAIPGWLTNGRGEPILLDRHGRIELTPDIHNFLVEGILNPMIQHLNRGRDVAGSEPITLFKSAIYPSTVEMSRVGTEPHHYFDATIVEHWNVVVQSGISDYLEAYFAPSAAERRVDELESEVARLSALLDGEAEK